MNKTRLIYVFCTLLFLLFNIVACSLNAQPDLSDVYYRKALEEDRSGNHDKTIYFFRESLKSRLCDRFIPLNDLESIKQKAKYLEDNVINKVAKTYRNIGNSHFHKLHFSKAIEYLQFSNAIYELTGFSEYKLRDLGNVYLNLSFIYDEMGERHKSIEAGEEALNLHAQRKDSGPVETFVALNSLAINYRKNSNYKKGIDICKKGATLYQSLSKENQDRHKVWISTIYHTWGFILHDQKNYERALELYNKSLEYDDSDPETTLNNIAMSLVRLNRFKEAEELLSAALDKKKQNHNSGYENIYSFIFESFTELELAKGNANKALDYSQQALINLTDNFKTQTIKANPKVDGDHYIYSKPDLLRLLDLKAQAAVQAGNDDLAFQTYHDLDQWTNEFYKDLSSNDSKLVWIAQAHETYGNAIASALQKNQEETAFQYAEKAHAVLLWQSLSGQAAKSILSQQDREQLQELNIKIKKAHDQFQASEISLQELRLIMQEHETLEKRFEQKYQEYAKRKYKPEVTTVKDIQTKIIDDQSAFLEYFRTDSILYVFCVTKDGLQVIKQPAQGLSEKITDFVNTVNQEKMEVERYPQLAYELFIQLVPKLDQQINRLVIVPDREIGTLPFAALTTQESSGTPNQATPFLIKKYAINYLYSAGSFLQLQQKKADQPYCFAGIAPVQYQDIAWSSLPNAKKELEGMKALHYFWNREILQGDQATKAAFINTMNVGYHTTLVSTHAVFDQSEGQIIFHDGVLDQGEIDRLDINTHRLILSACETGVGLQNRGEGVLSLGWSFAYKGVPSITMTHWKVNAYSTQKIMVAYHEQLNNGVAADRALQQAMCGFLRDDELPDAGLYAPYYWAAAFHTGNVN